MSVRRHLAHLAFHARSVLDQAAADARRFGPAAAWSLALAELLARVSPNHAPTRIARTRVSGYPTPVHYRPGTSDRHVMTQVLAEGEYRSLGLARPVTTIFDLGGNIGLTTLDLLGQFPSARVWLVEPDARNLAVARRTLGFASDRVTLLHAAAWGSHADLTVERGGYRDGGAWAYRTRVTPPGERPDVRSVTVPDLFALAGIETVDLLKMDIEGAEWDVFAPESRPEDWLGRVATLAVEAHTPEIAGRIDRACAPFRPAVTRRGVLTVYHFPAGAKC